LNGSDARGKTGCISKKNKREENNGRRGQCTR
jgi:hypothetical protein